MDKTDARLVGTKVVFDRRKREIVATITHLDKAYPANAYGVSWVRRDNPEGDPPEGNSIIHCRQIKRRLIGRK